MDDPGCTRPMTSAQARSLRAELAKRKADWVDDRLRENRLQQE
jgi:hypothetical protein